MPTTASVCPSTKKACAVYQSFSETGNGFQVQETCPDCGTGKGYTVTRDVGLGMIADKEAAEIAAAKIRQAKELAEKQTKQPSK